MAPDLAQPPTRPAATQPPEAQASYERLMSFTLRHEFYGGDLCPDMEITSTSPTQTLLRNLGLIARPRRGGVDIYFDTAKSAGIVRYLWESRARREVRHLQEQEREKNKKVREASLNLLDTHYGSWNRLTFLLKPQDELFSNFTEMPLDTPLGRYSLQIANRFAVQPVGDPVRLDVDWKSAERLLPALGGESSPSFLHFPTSPHAERFLLHDTSGRAILHAYPDYQPPADGTAAETEVPRRMRLSPGKDVHVDMANEYPGSFSYRIDNDYLSAEPAQGGPFFYAGGPRAPLLFVDLYLASPERPSLVPQGCYPIALPDTLPARSNDAAAIAAANAAARTQIKPLDYEIHLAARKTTWIYYIVLPSAGSASKELAIEAEPAGSLKFFKPKQIALPTGARAHRFVARKPMPLLRRRSDIALRLLGGGTPGNGSARILLEPLPTPSAEQVTAWPPGPLTDATAASEVFVYL